MKKKFLFNILLLIFFSFIWSLEGIELYEIPQTYLDQSEVKFLSKVKASVAAADFDLIKTDFPFLATSTDQAIVDWLLDNAAFFRTSQITIGRKKNIHGDIPTVKPTIKKSGFASSVTKRSVLVHVPSNLTPPRYLDLKGSGSDAPSKKDFHRNGVLRLDEALREFYMSKVVRRISQVLVPEEQFQVVDAYAVIHVPTWHAYSSHELGAYVLISDPPEKVSNSPSTRLDLAILVRQATSRSTDYVDYFAPPDLQLRFEQTLSAFNMTNLSNLLDVIYGTWSLIDYTNDFFFVDTQIVADASLDTLVDFNLVRFRSPLEDEQFKEKRVLLLKDLYKNPENASQGCINWNLGDFPVKSLPQCLKDLDSRVPLWKMPSELFALPAQYDLGIKSTSWTDLQYDFSAIFPPHQRDEIKELHSMGLLEALRILPDFTQQIFHRLIEALDAWPSLLYPLSEKFHIQDLELNSKAEIVI